MADIEKKCNICGNKFENSNKLNQHKKESHQENRAKLKLAKSSRYKATGIAAAVAVAIVLGVYFSDKQPVPVGVVQGVECDPTEGTVFHVHVHLDLFVDSKPVTIPAGIGIKPNECLYWVHTHNTLGVIHIESPEQKAFSLGQFIQVWDNTPNIIPKFEEVTHGDKNIKIFVNGKEVNDSYDKITLSAHDEIVLVSGNVPPSIPTSYEFGGL